MATTLEDRPDIAERYATATNSDDLTPDLRGRTDADVLLAAGIAARKDPRRQLAMAAFRMSVRGDMAGLMEVVDAADGWLVGRLSRGGRRPLPRATRRQLVVDTLQWWISPICGYCGGTGKLTALVEGSDESAGRLSGQACSCCRGTGRKPLAREVPPALQKHAEWMVSELDKLVAWVQADMKRVVG